MILNTIWSAAQDVQRLQRRLEKALDRGDGKEQLKARKERLRRCFASVPQALRCLSVSTQHLGDARLRALLRETGVGRTVARLRSDTPKVNVFAKRRRLWTLTLESSRRGRL